VAGHDRSPARRRGSLRARGVWSAWYLLGDLCQYVGKREEARAAFEKYFSAHHEDAEIEHLLIALKDEAPPERVGDRTIQHIYRGFAKTFDVRLVDDLKYRGPERLFELVTTLLGTRSGLAILDLGAGFPRWGPADFPSWGPP
jgi:predicted TPR repeat methyltransferase